MTKTVVPSHSPVAKSFQFVPEFDDDFIDLFPHRYDYLYAEHPDPGTRPDWQTESRHPLTDRLIKQGAFLFGVRFGPTTHYLMLDIDRKSAYHPARDPFAIQRIVEALEPLGLISYVPVQSSDSQGIHLYFPFGFPQPSWALAQAASVLLENKGFKLDRGQLELFPNARRYSGSFYNGHRLPLQQGSYLLNDDWQPIYSSQTAFVHQWRWADRHNSGVCRDTIEAILKQLERKNYRKIKGSAQKLLNDLNAEIEPGWTGFSQTNRIMGRIAMREYIFFHVFYGGAPLSGDGLAARIFEVATTLPGYERWCRHQLDIVDLCRDWARSVELNPKYFPYEGKEALSPALEEEKAPTWNEQQASDARERIRAAVAEMQQNGTFPDTVRGRIFAFQAYGISSNTLYKNKDLWHVENDLKPNHSEAIYPVEAKQDDPRSLKPSDSEVIHPVGTNKLSPTSVSAPQERDTEGRKSVAVGGCEGGFPQPARYGPDIIRAVLDQIHADRRRQRASSPPLDEVIPDENWFRQLNLPQVFRSPGGIYDS